MATRLGLSTELGTTKPSKPLYFLLRSQLPNRHPTSAFKSVNPQMSVFHSTGDQDPRSMIRRSRGSSSMASGGKSAAWVSDWKESRSRLELVISGLASLAKFAGQIVVVYCCVSNFGGLEASLSNIVKSLGYSFEPSVILHLIHFTQLTERTLSGELRSVHR